MTVRPKRSLAARAFRRCLLAVLIAVLGILTWYVWPQELIRPRFTISRETTYFTGPIDADGYVDYLAALNDQMQKGVTKENNAVVLLMQALGPKPQGGRLPPEFYQRLQAPEPSETDVYFLSESKFAKNKEWPENSDPEVIGKWIEHVTHRAWIPEQFPRMVEWLKANEKPMQILEEASKRMRYYAPMVYKVGAEPHQRFLMAALLPTLQETSYAMNLFVARALLEIGQKQFELAWRDLLTTMRLSRLIGQGTLIEVLVGMGRQNMAYEAAFSLLDSPEVKVDFLKQCQRDLDQLPPMPGVAEKIDLGQRCMALDSFMMPHRYGPAAFEALAGQKFEPSRNSVINAYRKLDWDPQLKKINAWYDQSVAIMNENDRSKQQAKFKELMTTINLMKPKNDNKGVSLWGIFDSTQTRLDQMTDILMALLTPAFEKVQLARERMLQRERLVRVGLALAIYQKEKGTYPATLAELAPKHLAVVPDDLFAGKPMIYRKTEDGHLLYSVGPNGLDEDGRDERSEPRGDDIVLRIPLPLPKKEE